MHFFNNFLENIDFLGECLDCLDFWNCYARYNPDRYGEVLLKNSLINIDEIACKDENLTNNHSDKNTIPC